jgi:hypothetical protein
MDTAEIPSELLQTLVERVVSKFIAGEINQLEAASRLVGTGRFEENQDALSYLKEEVCPRLEEKLESLEEQIRELRAQADRIRGVLGKTTSTSLFQAVDALPLAQTTTAPAGGAKSKKEKSEKPEKSTAEKRRKGASPSENSADVPQEGIWESHGETLTWEGERGVSEQSREEATFDAPSAPLNWDSAQGEVPSDGVTFEQNPTPLRFPSTESPPVTSAPV